VLFSAFVLQLTVEN